MYPPNQLFSADITVMTYRIVEGGGGGFEERRRGERYKLALRVELNNGVGTTFNISTSGIFFETESAHSSEIRSAFSSISKTRPSSARRAW